MSSQVQVHHYIVFIKIVWEKTYVFCTICLTLECLKLLKDSTDCKWSKAFRHFIQWVTCLCFQRRKLILCFYHKKSNEKNWTFDKINLNKAQWSQHAICGTSNRYNKMSVLVQNYDIILMFGPTVRWRKFDDISWNFVSSWYYQLYKKSLVMILALYEIL